MIDIKIGNSFELIKDLKDSSIDCIVTSSPYYSKRSYHCPPVIFDAKEGCEHEWTSEIKVSRHKKGETNPGLEAHYKENDAIDESAGQFCTRCPAWRGELGKELTPEDFIRHLLDFFSLAKPKLKDTGTCFINLGDTRMGSMQGYGLIKEPASKIDDVNKGFYCSSEGLPPTARKHPILKPKSLCLVPERFAWGMIEQGYILRNKIIWKKSNSKPESVKDRFSDTHEFVYFFVKSPHYYFNLDAVRKPFAASTLVRAKGQFISEKSKGEQSYLQADAQRKFSDKILSGEVVGGNPGDLWWLATSSYRGEHYATYPVSLVERCVLSGCPPKGTVLDPFAGSGTTGEFCRRHDRNAILFELNPSCMSMLSDRTMSHTPELSHWFKV